LATFTWLESILVFIHFFLAGFYLCQHILLACRRSNICCMLSIFFVGDLSLVCKFIVASDTKCHMFPG
jgi:hypothetical protein